MLSNVQIIKLLESLPIKNRRTDVDLKPEKLSREMASALGCESYTPISYCDIAVSTIVSKMDVQEITTSSVRMDKVLDSWLDGMDNLQKDLFKLVVRDGEAYILTTYEDGKPVYSLRETYDGIQGAATIFKDEKPQFTINTWYEETEVRGIKSKDRYLDIYYPSYIETYIRVAEGEWLRRVDLGVDDVSRPWPIDWTDLKGQPLGIALTRFDIGYSDIEKAVQLQRWLNNDLIDLAAVSRTMGWSQRVMTGSDNPEYLLDQYGQPMTGAFGIPYKRSLLLTPGSIFLLQGKDAKLEQLDASKADPTVYETHLKTFSLVTKVPIHYINPASSSESGVALIQREAPLNHLVETHQSQLTPSFEDLIHLSLRVSNTFGGTGYDVEIEVNVDWNPPEILTEDLRMEKQESAVRVVVALKGINAISLHQILVMVYPEWNEDQIQQEMVAINQQGMLETMPLLLPLST